MGIHLCVCIGASSCRGDWRGDWRGEIGVGLQRDYSKNVEHAFTMIISLRIHSVYSHLLHFAS